ncbi:hypothetical protein, partial [Acinetobacter baumannii]|uniref:hypothetical protein n=1 Tax=Acinetobacter baumannii TaxID=470 RepID=UPI00286ED94C
AGSVATVVLPGFEIGSTKQVTSLGVDHSGQGNVNTAYYSSPSVEARLNTGDGQDYVADKGAHLTLVYDQLSTTSY